MRLFNPSVAVAGLVLAAPAARAQSPNSRATNSVKPDSGKFVEAKDLVGTWAGEWSSAQLPTPPADPKGIIIRSDGKFAWTDKDHGNDVLQWFDWSDLKGPWVSVTLKDQQLTVAYLGYDHDRTTGRQRIGPLIAVKKFVGKRIGDAPPPEPNASAPKP